MSAATLEAEISGLKFAIVTSVVLYLQKIGSILDMENRVFRFYNLHQNKWFHIMNWSLEIIKTGDKRQRYMIMKYGSDFFF
jgi:hypothetical protein